MDILDQIEIALPENDKRVKTVQTLRSIVKTIPTEKGKKYAIAKVLNDPKFGLSNSNDFPDADKNAWSLSNLEDYTPPDIENRKKSEDEKDFWNWDSDRHWTKRGTDELKRRAIDAGFSVGDEPTYESEGYKAYMNAVRDLQTNKDREKIYDENAIPGTKLLYPRMTEKVLKGQDIEGKDIALDIGEQAMYAFNPAERLLGLTKVPMGVAKWGGALANPLAMESLDAAAYNGEDTDRAKFSPVDVGVGTLINRGVGKFTDRLNVKHQPKLPKEYETAASIAKREKFANDWDNKNEFVNSLIKEQELEAAKNHVKEAENLNYATLENLMELVKYGTGPEKEMAKTTLRQYAKNEAKNLVPNTTDFVSNKFGDAVSEDPKRTKKIAKRAFGPTGFLVAPQLDDMINAYYDSDKKNKEKSNIDKLIYGLEDWRK